MLVLDEKELNLERKKLENVSKEVKKTISTMSDRVLKQKEKIKDFQDYKWDNSKGMDVQELAVIRTSSDMEANILLREQRYFLSLFKYQNNPYFGSIIFNEKNGTKHDVYIGMAHLVNEKTLDNIIYDWRSPICSLFYDYEVGEASYEAPIGKIEGNLKRKRQYTIKDLKLIRMFDNSINISDDILQDVLEKESSEKMENIVNTIQKEQNFIIRGNEKRNLIIQGVAGSGKTSVALHRIAFLLYKIENLNSKNIIIFSPNNVFSEYISNVLPELGEENTLQTTFNDYLYTVITEYKKIESFVDFIDRYYTYKESNLELVRYKQSDRIINDITDYIKNYTKNASFNNSIIENDEYYYSKEDLDDILHNKYGTLPLFNRIKEMATKFAEQNYKGKKHRMNVYIRLLNESYNFKKPYKEIYYNFYKSKYCNISLNEKEISNFVNRSKINYEDALLFSYMKGLLNGFHYEPNILQVVIDEAQDYNKLQYIIISKIFKKANFTILGDINQTINPYYKYSNLNVLEDIFKGNYIELNKSYRSSTEIIEYTNNLLNLQNISAIRKKDNNPILIKNKYSLNDDIKILLNKYKSIAVITKDEFDSEYVYDLLKKEFEITLINNKSETFSKKLVVIPSYMAKGLEFDSVIIFGKNKYKEDEKNLLYVACTRAQHELIVYE